MSVVEELDLERGFHGGDGAPHSDAPSCGARAYRRETEGAEGLHDGVDIGLSGAVSVAKLFASEYFFRTLGHGWKSGFAAKLKSYVDGGVGIGSARGYGTGQRFAITTQDGRMRVGQDAPPENYCLNVREEVKRGAENLS